MRKPVYKSVVSFFEHKKHGLLTYRKYAQEAKFPLAVLVHIYKTILE